MGYTLCNADKNRNNWYNRGKVILFGTRGRSTDIPRWKGTITCTDKVGKMGKLEIFMLVMWILDAVIIFKIEDISEKRM